MIAKKDAICEVKPFSNLGEGNIYYTKNNGKSTLYAYLIRDS